MPPEDADASIVWCPEDATDEDTDEEVWHSDSRLSSVMRRARLSDTGA